MNNLSSANLAEHSAAYNNGTTGDYTQSEFASKYADWDQQNYNDSQARINDWYGSTYFSLGILKKSKETYPSFYSKNGRYRDELYGKDVIKPGDKIKYINLDEFYFGPSKAFNLRAITLANSASLLVNASKPIEKIITYTLAIPDYDHFIKTGKTEYKDTTVIGNTKKIKHAKRTLYYNSWGKLHQKLRK